MSELDIDDMWHELPRKATPLVSNVAVSDLARELVKDFDYQATGQTEFYPYQMPRIDFEFGIGMIVGASGTGKSTLLDEFGSHNIHKWDDRAIADHFQSADDARNKLFAVGLTSVPTWLKPYGVLSNGEKFRADLAVNLRDGAVIDEFTSVVDRNIAKASSKSLRKFVDAGGARGVVIATCHRDVLPYLQPDWIIDTDSGTYVTRPRECLHLESLVVQVYEVTAAIWEFYAKHHYLTADISPFARCFIGVIDEKPVAFESIITNPAGTVRDAYREHRLVTKPDYQGLGIGPRFSDFIGQWLFDSGKRFFSKTAHPRLGEYRERSIEWKGTSKNKKYRKDALSAEALSKRIERFSTWNISEIRFTYSHEFVGMDKQ